MNQHEQHKHQHGQHHGHHRTGKRKGLHKDWRAWAIVGLMLAAMLVYVLSFDESLQPTGTSVPGSPIDSPPPIDAAP